MFIPLLRRYLPHSLRPFARWLNYRLRPSSTVTYPVEPLSLDDYEAKLAAERRTFDVQTEVHDLPDIFHYWSNKFLRPMFEQYGFSNPDQFFAKFLAEAARRTQSQSPRFLSVGSGNCDTEVRVAVLLKQAGLRNFTIECLELSPEMLARGAVDAQAQSVSEHLIFTSADFNRWRAKQRYDGVMANQSLHHVLALEHLFDAIKDGLHPGGLFITSDMIGRNGHQRWPEALSVVQKFWQELPDASRYNLQLKRQEQQFMDWDCAVDGFEGIRAQEVLPELIKRFNFSLFIAFSNVVDVFIDRGFGHHLDPNSAKDQNFIDRLHEYDEQALARGEYTPTKLVAVMCLTDEPGEYSRGLTPERCVRLPS